MQACSARRVHRSRRRCSKGCTLKYNVSHNHRNVVTVECDVDTSRRWEQWFLVRADAHHDNPKSDNELEREHLQEASERGAGIIDAGDLFCAMQATGDRRGSKADVRPEHQTGMYLDSLVSTAADFYEPFAHNWIVLGRGNHEESVKRRYDTDLTQRLAAVLNDRRGSNVQAGGYAGFVRFQFRRQRQSLSQWMHYFHGRGGGGKTGSRLLFADLALRADADIYVTGHTHSAELFPGECRLSPRADGTIVERPIDYVCCGSYKQGRGDSYDGWETENNHRIARKTMWWLRFWWDGRRQTVRRSWIMAD